MQEARLKCSQEIGQYLEAFGDLLMEVYDRNFLLETIVFEVEKPHTLLVFAEAHAEIGQLQIQIAMMK